MTQTTFHVPEQHSIFSDIVVAGLTVAMIVLAGVLSLSQFAAAVI